MLRRAILQAARTNSEEGKAIKKLYIYRPKDKEWRAYFLKSNDFWLLAQLEQFPSETPVNKLVSRLLSRQLLRQVFACRLTGLPGAGATKRERLISNTDCQEDLQRHLAEVLSEDQDLVIVDIRTQENPLYRSPDVALEEDIRVVDEEGRDERLADMPDSLSQKVKVEPEAHLYVYMPVDIPDRDKRREKYAKLRSSIHEAIKSWFEGG